MISNKLVKAISLVGLNLLAIMNVLGASDTKTTQTLVQNFNSKSVDQLNMASLKSIEGTWLRVPHICKAKHFNADPSINVQQTASVKALEIFKNAGSLQA